MSHVYELYYKAFETLRRVREIKTVDDNQRYCTVVSEMLNEHLTVIPRVAMGVLECRDLMRPEHVDKFMNTLLRSVSLVRSAKEPWAEIHIAYISTRHCGATFSADGNI